MFEDWKEAIVSFVTSRIFVLMVLFLSFFGILLGRVFVLQIIEGQQYAEDFTMKIKKEVSIASTRGKIYDRNGRILADNVLSYSVTIEDNGTYENTREKQATLNRTILKVLDIVESHGDSAISDFGIIYQNGHYEYTQEGTSLLRFKADIYGYKTIDELEKKPEQYVASADQVIEFLCSNKKYFISPDAYSEEQLTQYHVPTNLPPEKILQLVTVRYQMGNNSYKRYVATTIASDVCDETVAEILESQSDLQGVDIAESSLRTYPDAEYFANIIGYIGKPGQDELASLQEKNENYEANDIVGKAGLEQYMETQLQGTKGRKTIYVDSVGNVLETESETAPESGKDLYLTIDKDLQMTVYHVLEQRLAGVLISKIRNMKQYTSTGSAADIQIPIYDVYYALINNHIIDTTHFSADDATDLEKSIQSRYEQRLSSTIDQIRSELTSDTPTAYTNLSIDMKNYMSYIVSDILMGSNQVLMGSLVDQEDPTYIAWAKDETISLKEYLQYAISKNWINVSGLDVRTSYLSSEEIYGVVVDFISTELENDVDFQTMLYKYILLDDVVTGREICLLLYEQGVLEYDEETVNKLQVGSISAYNFMLDKISNLEITPAQLALEPCSAGTVVTDPNTGEVLACVSYPGYDNNRLTNTLDSKYFAELNRDKSSPLYSKATQQQTAPGSTFKPVVAVAGLEEGVITPSEIIHATGIFTDAYGSPTCWIYNQYHGSHGNINMVDAIRVSCNYYFYEVGFRLGGGRSTGYSSDKALSLLAKYAAQFGLDANSGIELAESEPQLSSKDGVRSAIGQGNALFTVSQLARYVGTIANRGTVYNLTLLDKLTDSEGNTIEDYSASVYNKMEIADIDWDTVQEGMHQVALNTSVFKNLDLTIAGKTGTAQQSKSHPNHALFIGYAPYESPQLALAIRIANGYTSANAAAIASDIFKYYFNLEGKDEVVSGTTARGTSEVIND